MPSSWCKLNCYAPILIILLMSVAPFARAELLMCVDHYPPLQVVDSNNKVTGESVEVVVALAAKANIELEFTISPHFGNCMERLLFGSVDIVSGLLKTGQREPHVHFLQYSDDSEIHFIVYGDRYRLEEKSSLRGLRVARVKGFEQSSAFSPDSLGFTLVEVTNLVSAMAGLAKGEFDAIATTRSRATSLIATAAKTDQPYHLQAMTLAADSSLYIGLSKRSLDATTFKRLQQLSRTMLGEGDYARVLDEFRQSHPQYYRQ